MSENWFKPQHQPNKDAPVEFQLRPIDVATAYELQTSKLPNGALAWSSIHRVFAGDVIAWKGISEPCNSQTRFDILTTRGSACGFARRDWMIWLAELGAQAYRDAVLSEDEKKTS